MADVTYLRRHHHHEPDDDQTLIPLPYWPSTSDLDFDFDLYSSDPEFPSNHNHRFSRENFVMDLFQQRVEQSQITNHTDPIHQSLNDSVFDSLSFDLGFNPSDLHLDLNIAAEEDDDDFPDITISRSDPINGLPIVEIDSDSECEEVDGNGNGDNVFCGICMHSDADEDDFSNVIEEEEIGSFPLRWDSLHLEDDPQIYEDFEWEEVDGGGFDDREILGLMFAGDDDDNNNNRSVNAGRARGTLFIEQEEEEHEEEDGEEVTMLRVDGEEVNMMRVGGGTENLDWQVLLNSASPETYHVISEPDFGDNDDYIYTAEYEMMFGQFADNVNSFTSKPPASVAFVENILSVVVTKEDVDNNNALCAVCKDEFAVAEEVKLLPCSHRYHGDCIMPWLGIRNTCPVCRCEFPTDDADYERRKAPMLARSA